MPNRHPVPGLGRAALRLLQLEDRTTPDASATGVIITGAAPAAGDDTADTDGNNPVKIAVLGNDAAVGATLSAAAVQVVSAPTQGSVSVDGTTGEITYTATGTFAGTDHFQYTVKDSNGMVSNAATVTVVVNRPTANDDFTTTTEGTAVKIAVLGNDTDPDGPGELLASSVTVVSPPTHGAAVVDAKTGAITYTPTAGFVGTDTMRYTVTDAAGAVSASAQVAVVVTATGATVTTPTAADDVIAATGTNPVTVDVLANDAAPAGSKLALGTVSVVAGPAFGLASVNAATGKITYTASGLFTGSDTFTYTVNDATGATSNAGTVTIVVSRPTTGDDFAATSGSTPVVVSVLGNDAGGSNLDAGTLAVVLPAARGQTSVNKTTGEITYTAEAGFRGTDTFRYMVSDKTGATSAAATVTVVVNRPTANDDAITTTPQTAVTIPVLANDTNPTGPLDPNTVRVIRSPLHGTVSVDAASGAITYNPTTGFTGTDTFTYAVADDAAAESNAATVSIRVGKAPTPAVTAVGADVGGGPQVTVYNPDGTVRASFFAYDPEVRTGVRVAVGDVNGDGIADIVTAAGIGGGPQVEVFDGRTLQLIRSFFAYDPEFRGGVYVAVGDVNKDGYGDIITGVGVGGGPHVQAFSGKDNALLRSYFAYDESFRGGVTVAAGDLNGDGFAEIVTGVGPGGGPHVRTFDGRTGTPGFSFFAFAPNFSGGVNLAVGDVNGDGFGDLIVGAGTGGMPQVTVFSGRNLAVLRDSLVYDASFEGGVRVAAADVNGDGKADVVVGPGAGAAFSPRTLSGLNLGEIQRNDPFLGFTGGVFVGGNG